MLEYRSVWDAALLGCFCLRIWRTWEDQGVWKLGVIRELEVLVSVRVTIFASLIGSETIRFGNQLETIVGNSITSTFPRVLYHSRVTRVRGEINTRNLHHHSLMDIINMAGTIDLCRINILKFLCLSGWWLMIEYVIVWFSIMCQGLLLRECMLFHCCYSWIGCSIGGLCFDCWLCSNDTISSMRGSDCLRCGIFSGCGCSALCLGCYCCIPSSLRSYSVWCSVNNMVGEIYNIVISRQAIVEKDGRPAHSDRQLSW